MFTPENMIVGAIGHTVLDYLKMKKLKSENAILPKSIFKTASTDSASFYIDDYMHTIQEVITEYRFDDLRPTDIVLDIGANIGGFSLNVHKMVNHVYAVEPLFIDSLNKNIELNNAKNISIIPCALGYGEMDISFDDISRKVVGLPLEDIIKLCGGHIDFIKCDCEGGEWSMTLPEIMNVRRIEAEIHNLDGTHNFRNFENLLISSGFDYKKMPTRRNDLMLISAKNRYID